jgi:hypothetical protein
VQTIPNALFALGSNRSEALNEAQYRELCEACDSLLLSNDVQPETIAVSWLHVIREHPVFLKSYADLFSRPKTWHSRAKKIAKIAQYAVGCLRQIFRAVLFPGDHWRVSQSPDEQIDILFISHLLNESDIKNSADFYFGNLPEKIYEKGFRVLVALIDHTGNSNSSHELVWCERLCPRLVFSTRLDFQGELSIFRKLRKESIRIRKVSRKTQSDLFRAQVFSQASIEAMSSGSRAALRISEQVKRLVLATNPKMLIATYEGHAWERMAFSAARDVSAGVMCVGYQHAAIFRLQHSALRMLGKKFDPDLVLTAGAVSQRQIVGVLAGQGVKALTLGSNRAFSKPIQSEVLISGVDVGEQLKPSLATSNVCIVLPEGILSECKLMVDFSLRCAILMPEIRFILRLHPIVTPEMLLRELPSLHSRPANVEFSNISFEEDMKRASYALYRGSTAIVKMACYGVQPVYLTQSDEMTIDPLYELADHRVSVASPEDFKRKIFSEKPTIRDNEQDKMAFASYCADFYLPLDPEVIAAAFRLIKSSKSTVINDASSLHV